MKNIKIGLVNGLLYYDYKYLIDTFLNELNIPYVISKNTNKQTLEDGKNLLIDESCLAMKIYFGHLKYLLDKSDYILVIRCPSIRKNEMMCTNFYALYDLANNLFKDKIIELNIDVKNNITLEKAFINLGKRLGFNKKDSFKAFKKAYDFYLSKKEEDYQNQLQILQQDCKKILLVGHSYNLDDNFISGDIKKIIKENNIQVITTNSYNELNSKNYQTISKSIYWSKNIDILNALSKYKDYVNGIILISTFPCGPDSLVNEMIMRKIKLPILNLIIDEGNDNGGITTRVESFIDIINMEVEKYD